MAKKRQTTLDDPKYMMSPLAREIHERFKTASKHYAKWDEEAKEDYSFALGDQWSTEDRQALDKAGRPALTFNRIRPLINLIAGYQRENSSRIKVNPEGGEDKNFSEVMDRILKAQDKWSHLSHKLGYLFDDGCYCGKGFLEAILIYDNDPVRGEVDFKLRSPYQVLPDPECLEYDINDGALYCFKVVKLPRSKLLELYPAKKELIDGFIQDKDDPEVNGSGLTAVEGSDDDYGNRPNKTTVVKRTEDVEKNDLEEDDRFTVKEYWCIKLVDKYFVINSSDGQPDRFETKEEAEAFVAQQQFGKVITRKVKEMHVSAMCCGHILQEEDLSPFEPYYSGFPFFRYIADYAPNAEDEVWRVQGVTRPLKDPQKEKNKSKSQTLHILNTQANSGWVGDDDALTDEGKKKLEQMGSTPGITVWKKKGSELREILPKGPNMGHLQREQEADNEFKQISGINPDLMGFQEGTTSGKAISMRIQQAILALVRLFHNYRYTKECIGRFLLQMVPATFDSKKVMRVLGPEYMRKAVDPEKYPQGLTEGHINAFLQMVSDQRYDVFVTEADQNKTIRYEILQDLTELLKAGAPIPIDLVIDYLDLPNAEEVKQRVAQQQQMQLQLAAKGKPSA